LEKKCKDLDLDVSEKIPKFHFLQSLRDQWQDLIGKLNVEYTTPLSRPKMKHWYFIAKCIRKHIKKILLTTRLIRKEEWDNSKPYSFKLENMAK
jgi:hypothetical protein